MNQRIPTPVFVGAIALALVVVFWASASMMPTSRPSGMEGLPAPEIVAETAAGAEFRLSGHRNKVVLINFWATWCGPCRLEIPELIALQDKYARDGFLVVGVSIDEEGMAVVRPFAEEFGINYPVVVAPPGVPEAYGGVPAIPTSFLVDRAGNIVYGVEGLVSAEALAPRIASLL